MAKRTEIKENNPDLVFVDKCLFGNNKQLGDAAYKVMLHLMYAVSSDNQCDPESLHYDIEHEKKGLSPEEAKIIDRFVIAYTNSMCENKESVYEMKLKRKEMINNGKK